MFMLIWATLLAPTFWLQRLKGSLYFSWSYVSFVVQIPTNTFCLSVGPVTQALLLSLFLVESDGDEINSEEKKNVLKGSFRLYLLCST